MSHFSRPIAGMSTSALESLREEAPLPSGYALPQRAPRIDSFVSLFRTALSASAAAAAFLSEAAIEGKDDACREMTWRRGGPICTTADYSVHRIPTLSDFSIDGFSLHDLEWAPSLDAFGATAVKPSWNSAASSNNSQEIAASSFSSPHSRDTRFVQSSTESRADPLDSSGDEEADFVVVSHPQARPPSGIPLFLSLHSGRDDAPEVIEQYQSLSLLREAARSTSPDVSWASFDTPFASLTTTPEPTGSPTHAQH